ncbi:hypothetical protein F5887DRAFT_1283804 [Amanita rubescens]|nr:hypothetical protein F5887DRAFT_1283804 [Amanita rubescens]
MPHNPPKRYVNAFGANDAEATQVNGVEEDIAFEQLLDGIVDEYSLDTDSGDSDGADDLDELLVQLDFAHDTEEYEIKHFPGMQAGMPIATPTARKSTYTKYQEQLKGDSVYAPFASKLDWEVARWAKLRGPSSSALDELFKIEGFAEALGLTFRNSRELNRLIDQKLPGHPRFNSQQIQIGDEMVELYSRDVLQCIKYIYSKPEFARHLIHKPERHYARVGGRRVQVFHDMHTGQWWWSIQTFLEAQKPGASVIPVIVSTDRTKVTLFGSKTAYPFYLTIGNLPKAIRRKPSCGGQILLAYLPETKLMQVTNKAARQRMITNLFHFCLRHILAPLDDAGARGKDMSDGLGVVRRVHPVLASFVGDYPEQVLVTGVRSGDCPKCTISYKELGNPQAPSNLRDIHAVHDLLSKAQVDYQDYVKACKELRFKPIPGPFWAPLPFVDIFQAITPDILHQLHQGVLKHVIKWLVKSYGGAEIDARCQRLVPNHHIRIFKGGISGLSRLTGKEHAMIGHIILGVIADMSLPNGFDATRLLRAVRALLDFMFIAQLPIISTRHLFIMDQALDTFHKNKQIFVDLGIRDKFNIPKLHACLHYAHSMRLFGTTDNYDTQYTERLHRNLAKDPYRATNKRDELPQMTNCVERHEKVERHTEYITWQNCGPDSNLQTPSQFSLLSPRRYVKMSKFPNVQTISVEDVITQYGAEFFYGAFARFVVLWRHQQKNQPITHARLEQDILDIHIPFTHISVYHHIRFREDTADGPVVDSVHIQPHKKDRKGQMIAGRFDTGLFYSGEVDEAAGLQAYSDVQGPARLKSPGLGSA